MAIIKYKKGNSWFSIPIYVNTGGEVSDYVTKLELDNYCTKEYVNTLIPTDFLKEIPAEYITEAELNGKGYLTEHQSLANYYNKSEVDAKISSAGNFDSTQYYNIDAIDAMLKGYAELGDIPLDYLTASDLSGYAKLTSIPTTTSLLRNDSGFITTIPDEYITETELNQKGYLTEHQSLANYALKSDIPSVEGLASKQWVEDKNYLTSDDLSELTGGSLKVINDVGTHYIGITNLGVLEVKLSDPDFEQYSDIYSSIVNCSKSIHIYGVNEDIDMTIHPIQYEGYVGYGNCFGKVVDRLGNTYQINGKYTAHIDTMYGIEFNFTNLDYTPVDYLIVPYNTLRAHARNGVLVVGRKYAINDYTCIYRQPVTNIEMEINDTNENIRIICTATSSNTLSENVEYVRADGYVPIVECKYSIDPESKSWTAGMTSKSPKGVVWYMKDANGNECNYDFKHIKFRRWAITDITANLIEHDGTSNGVSPYRVKAKSISKIISDDRHRVGCGEPADEALIRNIVNGTWLDSTNDLKLNDSNGNARSFHSNYSKYYHKPYTDISKPRLKYLAWNTTMNEDITVSVYHGGLVLYSINSSSYEDMYTFDCNGDDMSELYYNNVPKVLKASIVAGIDIANFLKLPNIVIQTSVDSATISKFEIDMGYNNTILLYTYAGLTNVKLTKVSLHNFYKNLILTYNWNTIIQKRDDMYDNCMVGEIEKCLFATFYKNAIFGYISNVITTGNFFCNLWFNAGYRVNYNNSTSWESPTDSLQSKLNILKGGCYSNILGPMLYCTICPHHNSNTYRSYYYRGNFFNPNILHNSLGLIRYTKLDYKAICLAKTGTIEGCNINFEAFVGKDNYIRYINNSLYICGWNDSLRTQLPNMKKLSTSLLSGYYSEYADTNDEWHPYTDLTWDSSYSGNLHNRGILYADSNKKLLITTIVNII